jgi:hypothetical protein
MIAYDRVAGLVVTGNSPPRSIAFRREMGFCIVEDDSEVGGVSVHTDNDADSEDKVVFARELP